MSEEMRASPEAILRRLEMDDKESKRIRGRLKVFLGAAAGVGKTYQMLEEAWALKKDGLDIVAAVVETHGRRETEDLLQDMEMVPKRTVKREGIVLEELDIDAVLATCCERWHAHQPSRCGVTNGEAGSRWCDRTVVPATRPPDRIFTRTTGAPRH